MRYHYRGRLSPPKSWLTVFWFDPCDSEEKPVIALRSGIFVNGKPLQILRSPRRALNGSFEVIKRHCTSQRYDFARIISSNGGTLDCDLFGQSFVIRPNQMYHGLLIDYIREKDVYDLVLGPVCYEVPSKVFKDYSIVTPNAISTSVVCVHIRVAKVLDSACKSFNLESVRVECFPAQSLPVPSSVAVPKPLLLANKQALPSHGTGVKLTSSPALSPERTPVAEPIRFKFDLVGSRTLASSSAALPLPRRLTNSSSLIDRLFHRTSRETPSSNSSCKMQSSNGLQATGKSSPFRTASNSVSQLVHSAFEENVNVGTSEQSSLSKEEFDDLAPKLSVVTTLYERLHIYDKPLVTA